MPITTFEENLADAKALLTYSTILTTNRVRDMRSELRDRIGVALRVPERDRKYLDCIDNDQAFILFRDSRKLNRTVGEDIRPLLRQAIVAGCAAMETYLADKAIGLLGSVIRSENPPRRMLDIPLTVGQYLEIDKNFQRRGWGLRAVVTDAIRDQASTSPSQVGAVLGIIGIKDWSKRIDTLRRTQRGTTVRQLDIITDRRNQIAHSADRHGRGRASLDIDETVEFLNQIEEITHALDNMIDAAQPGQAAG